MQSIEYNKENHYYIRYTISKQNFKMKENKSYYIKFLHTQRFKRYEEPDKTAKQAMTTLYIDYYLNIKRARIPIGVGKQS